MSRSYWTVEYSESGNIYLSDGTIARPNESLELPILSNIQKSQLADGSVVFVTPENVYIYGQLRFIWYSDNDATIKAKIEGYVKNGDYVRITDHNSVQYVGKFVSITPVWISGLSDEYDIEAIFERIS